MNWRIDYYTGSSWEAVPNVIRGSVSVKSGFGGDPLLEFVAATGQMDWRCTSNAFHLSNALIAKRVRLVMIYEDEEIVLFFGTVRGMSISNDDDNIQIINYRALDFIDDLARMNVGNLEYGGTTTLDTAIAQVIGRPVQTDIASVNILATHDAVNAEDSSLTEIALLVRSAFAYAFLRYTLSGPIFRVMDAGFVSPIRKISERALSMSESDLWIAENGDYITTEAGDRLRFNATAAVAFGQLISGIPVRWEIDTLDVINNVSAEIRARSESGVSVVLHSSQVFAVGPMETMTVSGSYRDASGRACAARNFLPFTPGTDFTANTMENGAGADRTQKILVVAQTGITSVTYTITNTSNEVVYITKLQVRGYPVTSTAVSVMRENRWSMEVYGKHGTRFSAPYTDSQSLMSQNADWIMLQRGKALRYASELFIEGLSRESIMTIASVGVGDLVRCSAVGSETSALVVQGVEITIGEAGIPACTYKLKALSVVGFGISSAPSFAYTVPAEKSMVVFPATRYVSTIQGGSYYGRVNLGAFSGLTLLFEVGGISRFRLYYNRDSNRIEAVYVYYSPQNGSYTQTIIYSASDVTADWHTILVRGSPSFEIYVDGVISIGTITSSTIQSDLSDNMYYSLSVQHVRLGTYSYMSWFNRNVAASEIASGLEMKSDLLVIGTVGSLYDNLRNPAIELIHGLVAWEAL